MIHKRCVNRNGVSSVEQNHHKHDEVEKAIKNNNIQRQLVLLEERLTLLHVDIDKSWPLNTDELASLRDAVKLDKSSEPHEIWCSVFFQQDRWRESYQTFGSNPHDFSFTQILFDNVSLTLYKDKLAGINMPIIDFIRKSRQIIVIFAGVF